MRILLDENFPVDFAKLLVGHEVATVYGLGWSGIKNGELLRRAHSVCDVFVTLDRNLEFQQNLKVLPFGIVVVRARSNRVAELAPHIASILAAANRVAPGQVEKAGA
jgi:predicted nuclease of predicted toxin-antitoxin system